MPAAPKLTPEQWLEVRKLYHAGQLSISEIARQFDVSKTAIEKKAAKYGWQRDLTARINLGIRASLAAEDAKAEEGSKVGDGKVAATNAQQPSPLAGPLSEEDEREAYQRGVATGKGVIYLHRTDLRTGFALVNKLMEELNDSTDFNEPIRQQIVSEDEGKRRQASLRAVSLPVRAGVMRDLSMAMSRLMPLERQAFNLDDNPDGETYEQKLKRLMEAHSDA